MNIIYKKGRGFYPDWFSRAPPKISSLLGIIWIFSLDYLEPIQPFNTFQQFQKKYLRKFFPETQLNPNPNAIQEIKLFWKFLKIGRKNNKPGAACAVWCHWEGLCLVATTSPEVRERLLLHSPPSGKWAQFCCQCCMSTLSVEVSCGIARPPPLLCCHLPLHLEGVVNFCDTNCRDFLQNNQPAVVTGIQREQSMWGGGVLAAGSTVIGCCLWKLCAATFRQPKVCYAAKKSTWEEGVLASFPMHVLPWWQKMVWQSV